MADTAFDFAPFFTVLYQHLILIIHRPSLSLDPSPHYVQILLTFFGDGREGHSTTCARLLRGITPNCELRAAAR
jgi:hypothetical protein